MVGEKVVHRSGGEVFECARTAVADSIRQHLLIDAGAQGGGGQQGGDAGPEFRIEADPALESVGARRISAAVSSEVMASVMALP